MIIFTKFHEDQTKNVDFLFMDNSWMCLIFFFSDFTYIDIVFRRAWNLDSPIGFQAKSQRGSLTIAYATAYLLDPSEQQSVCFKKFQALQSEV